MVQHDFPVPPPDLLEQFIDYRAPPETSDELAKMESCHGNVEHSLTQEAQNGRGAVRWGTNRASSCGDGAVTGPGPGAYSTVKVVTMPSMR